MAGSGHFNSTVDGERRKVRAPGLIMYAPLISDQP